VAGLSQEGNIYETDALVAMYNEFHFGPQAMIPVEKFPVGKSVFEFFYFMSIL
jgi:hypothetical protein